MHLSLSLRPGLAADIEVRACRSPARMVAASYIAASGEAGSTTGRYGEDMVLRVLSKDNNRNEVCVKVYDSETRRVQKEDVESWVSNGRVCKEMSWLSMSPAINVCYSFPISGYYLSR